MSKYHRIIRFEKETDLLPYLYSTGQRFRDSNGNIPSHIIDYYAKKRNVGLILLVRYDNELKKYCCKVKCPVNPLPVCGEFAVPMLATILGWLKANGWERKESYHYTMFE